ncbi:lipopolysaccharide biosynthesis protein [Cyclobacterium plantarum]|uniref:Lipopolysaccharide biosynthesis protein n=1 Tax=Cyclobacterium plantarum TaxID=2716263 RepID=A0ABX0H5V6_9BACT|nr:lipopolysaccharide biosynthesis protein [Cyclobacterium plantarum]NHE55627.1 lipopolysaccharide biosynthesis protein [Cyclobacterium plantarum]
MSLKIKVKSGLKWNLINQVVSQVIFVWFGIYLARLLGPEAYGLVGMITVFSGFANLFVDFGFSSAIVYDPKLTKNKISSVFWLNFFIGVVIYLIFYFGSPLLADFYKLEELKVLTRVVTISLIINSLTGVPNSLISKSISFKEKIKGGWISTVISYSVAFYLAFNGYGVWSLVFQTLLFSFFNLLFVWKIADFKPGFYFSYADIRSLILYGSGIAGTNLLGYLTRNLDNLLIGKFLGGSSLGIYSRSYGLMMLPIKNISSVFTKVLFPAFSKIQNQPDVIAFYYLKATKIIALFSFPIMFCFFAISKEFVLLFLGKDWVEAIFIIQMLSILGAVQSILTLNGVIYNSLGKATTAFKVTLFLNFVLIPSWFIGMKFGGLNGLVIAYVIIGTFGSIPILAIALRYIHLSVLDQLKNLFIIILGSVSIIISSFLIDLFFTIPLIYSFIFKIIIGGIVFLLIVIPLEKGFLFEIYNIIVSKDKDLHKF